MHSEQSGQGPYYYEQEYGRDDNNNQNNSYGQRNRRDCDNRRNDSRGPNAQPNVGGNAYGRNYGQYEQNSFSRRYSDPYQYQGEFDPEDGSYNDDSYYADNSINDEYRQRGYGTYGQNESFGRRPSMRDGGHSHYDDVYPHGHAQRHDDFGYSIH